MTDESKSSFWLSSLSVTVVMLADVTGVLEPEASLGKKSHTDIRGVVLQHVSTHQKSACCERSGVKFTINGIKFYE